MMIKYILLSFALFAATLVHAQKTVEVSGFVQDSGNRGGISGVSIRSVKTDRVLGSTNNKGYFKVTTVDDDVLLFSSLDYNTYEEKLQGKRVFIFTVYLEKKETAIQEVVVQGYSTRRQETLTGSSVRISGEQLQDVPVSNVMELLQGKVPGLNIQVNSGQPGVRNSVMLRGLSNISQSGAGADGFLTPTSPLYIVDGVMVDDNTDFEYGFNSGGTGISPIALIPPEDIESVDILKDAAATALYGSRGAYGVIIITTKRGKSKTPIIQYTTNHFLSVPPQLRSTMGGVAERMSRIDQVYQYSANDYAGRDLLYDNQILSDSLNPYFNNSTDWQRVFYNSQYSQTHNVNASGGDVTFNYKINGSYYNQKGIIENTGFNRYTLTMNSEYRPSTKFRLFTSMAGNIGEQKTGSGNSVTQGGVASAASASSLLPAPSSAFVSPAIISTLNGRNDNRSTDIKAAVDLDYEFIEGLRLRNNFTFNYINDRTNNFTPAIANNNRSVMYNFDSQRNNLYNMTQLNYIKSFGDHMLNTFVFSEITFNDFMAKAQQRTGLPNDQIEGPFGAGGPNAIGGVLNNLTNLRTVGFAGAISYNYATKYIFDVNFRLDKSSNLGPDVPWSRNPAFSARWNIDRENFMEDFKDVWLDYLSLRGSWGKNIVPSGNIFDANGKYIYTGAFNNSPTIGFNWGYIPNRQLIPSTTTQTGLAIEAGFLNGLINTTHEVYYKQVDNQLWDKNIADHNAFAQIKTNEVSLVNYGYEFMIGFRPLTTTQQSGWAWDINLNGAINRDVLTMLPDQSRQYIHYDNNDKYHTLYRLGRNSMTLVLYDYRGTFATDADVPVNPATGEPYKIVSGGQTYHFKAGDPYWTDLNGDYILDENDLVFVGNAQPILTGGISTNLRYKGFTFNTQLSYTYDRDIINKALADQIRSYSDPLMNGSNSGGGTKNSSRLPFDKYTFWRQPGDQADMPNPFDFQRSGIIEPFRANQTLFMEDGSYLKVNYVTLGYNIPREVTQRYGVTSFRLYFTANNPIMFTKYSGANPEGVTASGYDRSDGYPVARSYTLGLNVQF